MPSPTKQRSDHLSRNCEISEITIQHDSCAATWGSCWSLRSGSRMPSMLSIQALFSFCRPTNGSHSSVLESTNSINIHRILCAFAALLFVLPRLPTAHLNMRIQNRSPVESKGPCSAWHKSSDPLSASRTMPSVLGPTTRSNRPRKTPDTPVRGRSKQGCWTCRLRRKKCDEQCDDSSGQCHTCKRLKIRCIGWGDTPPDWVKNPDHVKAFKDSIKGKTLSHIRSFSAPSMDTAFLAPKDVDEESPTDNPTDFRSPQSERGAASLPTISPTLPVHKMVESAKRRWSYRTFVDTAQVLFGKAQVPQDCMLAIQQTVELGRWKQNELDKECLSYRTLARCALHLERLLDQRLQLALLHSSVLPAENPTTKVEKSDFLQLYTHFNEDDMLYQGGHSWSGGESYISLDDVYPPLAPSSLLISSKSQSQELESKTLPSGESPVALPYLTALLFLHAVVSGFSPNVPEIMETTQRILVILRAPNQNITLLQRLPATALVARLSEDKHAKELFDDLLLRLEDPALVQTARLLSGLGEPAESSHL